MYNVKVKEISRKIGAMLERIVGFEWYTQEFLEEIMADKDNIKDLEESLYQQKVLNGEDFRFERRAERKAWLLDQNYRILQVMAFIKDLAA